MLISTPEGEVPIEMSDRERLPAGEELVIGKSRDGYSVTFRDEHAAPSVETLRIRVTGDPRGGMISFFAGDREGSVSFSSLFDMDNASLSAPGAGVFEMVLPLPSWFIRGGSFIEDSGLTFFPGATGQYRVDAITFGPHPSSPSVGLRDDGIFTVDYRLPVSVEEGRWIVRLPSESMASDPVTYALSYRWIEEEIDGVAVFGDRSDRPHAMISDGATRVRVNMRPRGGTTTFRPALWGLQGEYLQIERGIRDYPFQLTGFSVVADSGESSGPITVELSELTRYPVSSWRNDEFELFSWSTFPDVLWVDSVSYAVQSKFFKRMAFFVEKRGYIGSLLTDEELSGLHGYNAHNYRPEGLADFYTAAEREDFPLNSYELLLRDVVERHGIIIRDERGGWRPGSGGVLGVSRESTGEHRRLLVVHEAMHGVLYEEDEFHRGVSDYWRSSLSERERQYWRDMLGWMGYAPGDEYLMYNEFQAYLLQRPEAATRWYFRSLMADRVRNARGRREPVDTFLGDHPTTFVDSAAAMNDLLFRTTGLIGGNPYYLEATTD